MMKIFPIITFVLLATLGCRTPFSNPNCRSTKIELMDTCLLGITIQKAIKKLAADSSRITPILLAAREIHGVRIRTDSAFVILMVEKPYVMSNEEYSALEKDGKFDLNSNWKQTYKYIADRKIISVCSRNHRTKKPKHVGEMIPRACDVF